MILKIMVKEPLPKTHLIEGSMLEVVHYYDEKTFEPTCLEVTVQSSRILLGIEHFQFNYPLEAYLMNDSGKTIDTY